MNRTLLSIALISLVVLTAFGDIGSLVFEQLGGDINSVDMGRSSGSSVSLSANGNRLAVGSKYDPQYGRHGHVRVFEWSGNSWKELGTAIIGDDGIDQFGETVSLSTDGERLAIGASDGDHNGENSGYVRVYRWTGQDWQQLGSDIDGKDHGFAAGRSVSLSANGDRVAIGVPVDRRNGTIEKGRVYVYHWSGTAWQQLGNDIMHDTEYTFGKSVSLSAGGDRLATGGYSDYSNGQVSVYQWTGTKWVQLGAEILGETLFDSISLSDDGQRVAIGTPRHDGDGISYGQVRVYAWSGSEWVQLGSDFEGVADYGQLGASVSLSADGGFLAIGAHPKGHGAHVYQWSGNTWVKLQIEASQDYIASVSLSDYGTHLAIGEPNHDNGNWVLAGRARVFRIASTINSGFNDAWYNPDTSGQGFFITIFPDLGKVSLAWFTYDTELPPIDAVANLGDAGHRWLTALGSFVDNQAVMNISIASGGLFDTTTEIQRTDPPGSDGTIILTFNSCNSGTVEYDIPSINRQGIVPIQRVATDNVALCEALLARSCDASPLVGMIDTWANFWGVDFPQPDEASKETFVPRAGYVAYEFNTGDEVDDGLLTTTGHPDTLGTRIGAISECPGDFNVAPECDHVWGTDGGISWSTSGKSDACQLKPNTTYYFNLTFTDGVDSTSTTCTTANCITTVQHVNH